MLSYADRVMVMEDGKILALAPPRNLAEQIRGNDMFQAMPVPMRIYDALGGTGDCPVTVREGREWLQNIPCPAASKEPEADVRMACGEGKKGRELHD